MEIAMVSKIWLLWISRQWIPVYRSLWGHVFIWKSDLRVEGKACSHGECSLTLWEAAKLFSKEVASCYTPSSIMWEFQLFFTLASTWYGHSLVSAVLVDHKKLLLAVKVSFETKVVLTFQLIIYLKIIRVVFLPGVEINVVTPKIQEGKRSLIKIKFLRSGDKYSRPTLVGPCEHSWTSKYIATLKNGKRNWICIGKARKVRRQSGCDPVWSVTNGWFFSTGEEYHLWLRLFLFF